MSVGKKETIHIDLVGSTNIAPSGVGGFGTAPSKKVDKVSKAFKSSKGRSLLSKSPSKDVPSKPQPKPKPKPDPKPKPKPKPKPGPKKTLGWQKSWQIDFHLVLGILGMVKRRLTLEGN